MGLTQIILQEFQSKQYLYHFTSVNRLGLILNDDTLEASSSYSSSNLHQNHLQPHQNNRGVSFTRNRLLAYTNPDYISGNGARYVGLVFDRNKLKARYKLYPYDVHNVSRSERFKTKTLDEEIILQDITKVSSLLEFVYIPVEYYEKNFKDGNKFMVRELTNAINQMMRLSRQDYSLEWKYFKGGNFKDVNMTYGTYEKIYNELF